MSRVIGIDEAGRGPLAGPIAFGACSFAKRPPKAFFLHFASFPFGSDSKKLTESSREYWFGKIREAKRLGLLDFAVVYKSSSFIDNYGLTLAGKKAIDDLLAKLSAHPAKSRIFLDGGLKAPEEFKKQETIIKGDEDVFVISLASIVAKVSRDRVMKRLSKIYSTYGFDQHKGYATKAHFEALRRHGITPQHRKRFLRKWQAERTE